jgi:DNA-binding response OmpR family regulator
VEEPAQKGSWKAATAIMKVLLVDDNEELREFLTLSLSESNMDVVAAADGAQALAAIEKEKFEVAIIDSVMPGEDGIALTMKIRATKAGQKLPILVMSALSTALARRMAKNAGANEFLPKPFSPTQLLEQVRSITRG